CRPRAGPPTTWFWISMSGPNASRQPGIAGNGCELLATTTGRSKLPFTTTFRSGGGAAVALAGATARVTAAKAAPSRRRARGMGSLQSAGVDARSAPTTTRRRPRALPAGTHLEQERNERPSRAVDAVAETTVPPACYRIVARRPGFLAGIAQAFTPRARSRAAASRAARAPRGTAARSGGGPGTRIRGSRHIPLPAGARRGRSGRRFGRLAPG